MSTVTTDLPAIAGGKPAKGKPFTKQKRYGAEELQELQEALDALRVAITLFDEHERLTWCNQHFNYLFRSMPLREELQGLTYAELIRLEVEGGEIAPRQPDLAITRSQILADGALARRQGTGLVAAGCGHAT